MSKLTFVIPLKRSTHSINDEVVRFCKIGLRSLLKYFTLDDVDRLVIICPGNEQDYIEEQVRYEIENQGKKLRLRFIHDEWLSKLQTNGWLFQQLLKLEVARFVYTRHYLVLDSDIYLTKPASYSDFVETATGKLLMTTDPLFYHPEWFTPSCQLLKTTIQKLYASENERVMQVTPQILITEEVIGLLDYLHAQFGTEYQKSVLQNGFTEYSLYWSYLKQKGKTELYQLTSGGNIGKKPGSMIDQEMDTKRLMGNALWFAPEAPWTLETWVQKQFSENHNYYFSLIQSNIRGLSLQDILSLLAGKF